jgi:hypothetical protein
VNVNPGRSVLIVSCAEALEISGAEQVMSTSSERVKDCMGMSELRIACGIRWSFDARTLGRRTSADNDLNGFLPASQRFVPSI